MRCVVFGGAGYIGSHLVERLRSQGHEPTVLTRRQPLPSASGIRHVRGSLDDPEVVRATLQGADMVFHLAWEGIPSSSPEDFAAELDENLSRSVRLFEQCVALGIPRILFCSSGGAVYGPTNDLPITEDHPPRPMGSYGRAKLAVESALENVRTKHGIQTFVVRPGNAYGGRQRTDGLQGVIGRLIWCVKHEHPFSLVGGGTLVRDFIHVEDVADAIASLATYKGNKHVFNVGTGTGTTISKLVELVEASTGRNVLRRDEPARWYDVPASILASGLLQRETGWKPRHDLATEIRLLCEP